MKRSIIVLVLGLGAGVAFAGGTGGRMGGGSWGSTSSSSPSSSGSWSSSSSSSHSWSPPSSSDHTWSSSHGWDSTPSIPTYHPSYTPTATGTTRTTGTGSGIPYDPAWDTSSSSFHDDDVGFNFAFYGVFALILGVFAFNVFRERMENRPLRTDGPDVSLDLEDTDVSVLRVAIDGRARKFLQHALGKLAAASDTATDEGRVAMLRDVTRLVRGVRDAWVYAGATNLPMTAMANAKATFDGLVDDARARFQHETITNEQGQRATAVSPGYTPHSDEGPGLVLVSIILAARTELYTVSSIGNGDDLRRALDAASHLTTDQLIAVEVVWMPSEDGDRLSSIELEAKYPRPALIPIAGALVGKTFCDHCGGPYPAELVSCPHCGAPALHRAA